MRPYAEVIGDPIAHSKSPALHHFWLKSLELEGEYRAVRVSVDKLGAYIAQRRDDPAWRGCNVTAPLKEAVAPFLNELSDTSSKIGAVNCVHRRDGRLIGENTDIDGIAKALPAAAVAGASVSIIGAGGAARSTLYHLVRNGAKEIRVFTRRPACALALQSFAGAASRIEIVPIGQVEPLADANILVNATPLGMSAAPMPGRLIEAVAAMKPSALVFDMVYDPIETDLLRAARRSGLATIDGLTMLIGQARKAFELFFNAVPPRECDLKLRARLAGPLTKACIVLVGLPGVGKTTVGEALAERLGLRFFDSDQEIECLSEMSIAEFFDRHGEQVFRDLERDVAAQLIKADGRVVALGGGAFADSFTRDQVKQRATSIWLDASLDTIGPRLEGGPERPLLKGSDSALQDLAETRWPSYAQADIRIAADTLERTLDDIERMLTAKFDNAVFQAMKRS